MDLFGLFLEGLLSFLSPCVLPLVPLYMSYLSSDANSVDEDGNIKYKTVHVFILTVFFVLGVSVVFVIAALSANLIATYLDNYSEVIQIVGGTILIIVGLNSAGLISINVLNNEKRINLKMDLNSMNYFKALLLGFVFSFAYSPCIGPILGNAMLLASTESYGSLYILVYALGLIIPFLITGLFTAKILEFIKNKKNIFKYVMIIAGVIMIAYGGYMIYKGASDINTLKNQSVETSETTTQSTDLYVPDTELELADGTTINLNDYQGKYIILNFTTTWCSYCKEEMPYYIEYASNNDEAICLYVMSVGSSDVSKDELINFTKNNDIESMTIIDDGDLYSICSVNGYPTKFVIDQNGKFLGYISGAMDKDGLDSLLETAKSYE